MMPGKDGFEVCRDLTQNKELKTIPVIFLTAKVKQESINKGLELGAAANHCGAEAVKRPDKIE